MEESLEKEILEEENIEQEKWKNRHIVWDENLQKISGDIPSLNVKSSSTSEFGLYKQVKGMYEKAQRDFLKKNSNTIEEQLTWKGTSTDQVNAICLQISRGSIYRVDLVERMLRFCEDKQYRRCSQSIEAMTSMFLYHLLPPRKLRSFPENNLQFIRKKGTQFKKRREVLLFWYFENELKKLYNQFIEILGNHLKSKELPVIKRYVLKIIRILCYRIQEGKDIIVDLLIGILKSPKNPLASKVLNLLLTMINPGRSFYCFPGNEKKRLVQSIVTLIFSIHNEVIINGVELLLAFRFDKETELELILMRSEIVLKIIDKISKNNFLSGGGWVDKKKKKKRRRKKTSTPVVQRDEVNVDLLVKLLKNFRFSVQLTEIEKVRSRIDMFFDIARKSNFSVSVEASNVLFSIVKIVSKEEEEVEEKSNQRSAKERLEHRYFMLLYSLMIKFDGFSYESKSSEEFLNLLKFSILYDSNITRAKAFIKRFFQVLYHTSPNFTASGILAIRWIFAKRKELRFRFDENAAASKKSQDSKTYNPNELNPSKSGSEEEPYWDLLFFQKHFHPLVSDIAGSMIGKKRNIAYRGESMKDFHTTGFLDEFIRIKGETSVSVGDEKSKDEDEDEDEEENEGEGEEEEEEEEKKKEEIRLSFLSPFFKTRERIIEGKEKSEDLHLDARFEDLIEDSKRRGFFKSMDKEFGENIDEKKTGFKRRRVLDFSDNRIEKVFLALEEKDGDDDWEKELLKHQPPKKRRKISHTLTGDTKNIEEEISVFHEEMEEKGVKEKSKDQGVKIMKKKTQTREKKIVKIQSGFQNKIRFQPKKTKRTHIKFKKKRRKKK